MVILGVGKNPLIQNWTSSVSQRRYLSVLQHNANYPDTDHDEKTYEKKIYLISIPGAEEPDRTLKWCKSKINCN